MINGRPLASEDPKLGGGGAGLRNDDNYSAQLDRLAANETPPELRVPFRLAGDVEETIMHCALRFDGYAWLKAHPGREENGVLREDHLRELLVDADAEVNFTAFFLLQRFCTSGVARCFPER
jgi:hypothetical protein